MGTIRKTLALIIFLIYGSIVVAQRATDGVFLFKTWFFLERQNENFRLGNMFDVKNHSLFGFLNSFIEIRADTLESRGFSEHFVFLSVALLRNDIPFHDSAIIYKSFKDIPNKEVHLGIPVNNCNGYVLCVNNSSGRSFRIQGFYGNDFLSLLQEVKEEFNSKPYNQEQNKTLSTKEFLRNYSVDGIDFKCIYMGLSSGEMDSKKYPCLKSCSNSMITVH